MRARGSECISFLKPLLNGFLHLNGFLLSFWFIATVGCAESSNDCTEYTVLFYELLELPLSGQVRIRLTT